MDIQKLGTKLDEILHRFATYEDNKIDENNNNNNNNSDLLSDILNITQIIENAVETVITDEKNYSLPVKTLEELRMLSSACWNMTIRHFPLKDNKKEQKIKASLRDFATRSFLLGNYAYSTKDVCYSYFTHHAREAEQCVLMCLKTSRDLSLCGMSEKAKGLLLIGEVVSSYIHPGVKDSLAFLKYRNISWEFAYTNMDVMWNLKLYKESFQAAEKLSQMLIKNNSLQRDHREAFFRFIFTIGNTSLENNEEYQIRNMLSLSIEVQNHFKANGTNDAPHHFLMLRGATLEQIAFSWLREGKYLEAVEFAKEADSLLHSTTTALLRLKATAEAKMESESIILLHEYVQRSDIFVDEAVAACFELHKIIINQKEGSIEGMKLIYKKYKNTQFSESVTFRFIQLLLHDGSLNSCQTALQILINEAINFEEVKCRRYCFMWLWELSDTNDFTRLQIVESLETALKFKDCASENEINSIQLRLCTEYIINYEEGKQNNAIILSKNILYKCTEEKPRCAFTHCLLFKIAVLESNEVDINKEIQFLVNCEPKELVIPAFCTAINYCLKRGYLNGVSLVSERAIFSPAPFPDILTEIELLKVYVASLLSKACKCTEEQLRKIAERFLQFFSDDSITLSLKHDDIIWWTQGFLLLGSEFTDGPGITSLLLFRAATFIIMQDSNPGDSETNKLISAGFLCILEDEFQLFSTGRPEMELHDLEDILNLSKDILSTSSIKEYRITVLLAEAELHLRQPSEETLIKIDYILKELSNLPITFEDFEALADGASFTSSLYSTEYPFLHEIAMKLYIHAAGVIINPNLPLIEINNTKDENSVICITDAFSCLYKSFLLSFDRTEQMSVIQELMKFLSFTMKDVTVNSFIKHFYTDENLTIYNQSISFTLLFLEYFTVEAWNNSVFYLHLTDSTKQMEWMQIAWSLVDILPKSSSVASALLALKTLTSF